MTTAVPPPGSSADLDRAAVGIHDRAGDREAEAGPRAPLPADERLEDVLAFLPGDARALDPRSAPARRRATEPPPTVIRLPGGVNRAAFSTTFVSA